MADHSLVRFLALGLLVHSLVLSVSVLAQPPAPTDWAAADMRTARLPPSAFSFLSFSVRQELSRRGCTIPQTYFRSEPHNVIVGAFTSPEPQDVAVLCSRNRVSSILVFRGGSAELLGELAPQPDIDYLQVVDGRGTIGFSREIAAADASHIRQYVERNGGPAKSPEHAGIEDSLVEKASVVWYWNGGRWIQIFGAD